MSRADGNRNDRQVKPTAASDHEKAAMVRALLEESPGDLACRLQTENEAFRKAFSEQQDTKQR